MTDKRLTAPVDGASLAALRALFGLVMSVGLLRQWVTGWTGPLYTDTTFHFRYPGFAWVPLVPATWVVPLVLVLAALAAAFALGVRPRVTGVLFTLGFAWLQLHDAANYLNHYYLAVLLGAVLALTAPAHGEATVPRWALWLVRFQIAAVYVHAGLAKLNADWLLHAQPLGIWLAARSDVPVLGKIFAQPVTAIVASWFGFLYDTTIVGFLSWKRTRAVAFAAVCFFHAMTAVLFDIGLFPFIMTAAATIFFEPAWPRRFLRASIPSLPLPQPMSRGLIVALAIWVVFQSIFPLRHLLYPGQVAWSEQGMRWSWKVMLREKSGAVTFYVRSTATGRTWQVSPEKYLLPRQVAEMSGQPELILQLAHRLATDFERDGRGPVEVRAEAWVSMNGRPPALLIDPSVDLAHTSDGLWSAPWVLPAPQSEPLPVLVKR